MKFIFVSACIWLSPLFASGPQNSKGSLTIEYKSARHFDAWLSLYGIEVRHPGQLREALSILFSGCDWQHSVRRTHYPNHQFHTSQCQTISPTGWNEHAHATGALVPKLPKQALSDFVIRVRFPQNAQIHCQNTKTQWQRGCQWELQRDQVISYGFGHHISQLWFAGFALLFLLLARMAAAHWLRHQATVPTQSRLSWFEVQSINSYLDYGFMFSWFSFAALTQVSSLLSYLGGFQSNLAALTIAFTVWNVPVLGCFLLSTAIVFGVHKQIHHTQRTLGETLSLTTVNYCVWLVPLFLLILGSYQLNVAEFASTPWLVCGVVSFLLLRKVQRRLNGEKVSRVHQGRLLSLVEQVGRRFRYSVEKLYLITSPKEPIANAQVSQENKLVLSDQLVEHLTESEIKAIIAHEIAHIKLGHPNTGYHVFLSWFFVSGIFLLLSALFGKLSVLTLIPLLIARHLYRSQQARKMEAAADRYAVKRLGSGTHLITALSKLSQLNRQPIALHPWIELGLSHPCTFHRAHAIAKQCGISQEQCNNLLNTSPTPINGHLIPEPYSLSFLDRYLSLRGSFVEFFSFLALVVPCLILIHLLHIDLVLSRSTSLFVSKPWLYLAVGTLCILITRAVNNYIELASFTKIRLHLEAQLKKEGIDTTRGYFMGLSPSDSAKLYGQDWYWDFGFVFLNEHCLTYIGTKTRFSLSREQIKEIHCQNYLPHLPRLHTVSLVCEQSNPGVIQLCSFHSRGLVQMSQRNIALTRRLQKWRNDPIDPSDPSRTAPLRFYRSPDIATTHPNDPKRKVGSLSYLFGELSTRWVMTGLLGTLFGVPVFSSTFKFFLLSSASESAPIVLSVIVVSVGCLMEWVPFATYQPLKVSRKRRERKRTQRAA